MRSNIAKALSILGVVAAGSAATAINTQALQSHADATVGDATALLAPKSPSLPTPTITIFKTAKPVAGPMIPVSDGTTQNANPVSAVPSAQPSKPVYQTKTTHKAAVAGSNDSSNEHTSQPVPEVSTGSSTPASHTSTGGSSYTSGGGNGNGDDHEDGEDREDREDNDGGESDDD